MTATRRLMAHFQPLSWVFPVDPPRQIGSECAQVCMRRVRLQPDRVSCNMLVRRTS